MPTPEVSIWIRAKDLASQVLAGTERKLRQLGVSARGLATAFGAVVASATGLGILGKKLFDVGVAATESREKFTDVFGSFAGSIEGVTTEIGRMAGLSKSAAQGLVADAGFMAQSMGFTQAESAKLSAAVFKLAGDLSAFKDIPLADALEKVTSGLAGQTRGLKELGIVIDADEVKRRAMLRTGKATAESLTQEEEATAALALMLERAGAAIGELERDSHKAGGAAQKLRADFANMWEDLAVKLLPTLAGFIPIIDGIGQAIARNLPTLVQWVQTLTDAMGITDAIERAEVAAIASLPADQLAGRKAGLESQISSIVARLALPLPGAPGSAAFKRGELPTATERDELAETLRGLDAALTFLNRRIAAAAMAMPGGGGLGAPVLGTPTIGPIAPSKLQVAAPGLGGFGTVAGPQGQESLDALLNRAAESSVGLGRSLDQLVQEAFRAETAIGAQLAVERERHALIKDLTLALQSGNLSDREAAIAKQLLKEATDEEAAAARNAARSHTLSAAQIVSSASSLIAGIISSVRGGGGIGGFLSGVGGLLGFVNPLIGATVAGVGQIVSAATRKDREPVEVRDPHVATLLEKQFEQPPPETTIILEFRDPTHPETVKRFVASVNRVHSRDGLPAVSVPLAVLGVE